MHEVWALFYVKIKRAGLCHKLQEMPQEMGQEYASKMEIFRDEVSRKYCKMSSFWKCQE